MTSAIELGGEQEFLEHHAHEAELVTMAERWCSALIELVESWPSPARLWWDPGAGKWNIVRRTEAARRRVLYLRRADASLGQRFMPYERQILVLAADGNGNAQIAAALRISSSTVSRSIQRCLPALGLASRAELSLVAGRRRSP